MSENSKDKTKNKHLQQHKGRKFDQPDYALERRPIAYGPSIDSGINHDRLPEQGQLANMELAYREQPLSNSTTTTLVKSGLRKTMLMATFLAMIFVTVLPILPWSVLLYFSTILSILSVIWIFKNASFSLERLLLCAFLPPIATFAFHGLANLTSYRFTTVILLSAATIYTFNRWGAEPFNFHRAWLLTHPRLKPKSRHGRHVIESRPDLFVLSGVLFIACLIPLFSTWLAMFAIAAVSMISIIGLTTDLSINSIVRSTLAQLKQLSSIAANYSYYGLSSSGAPGIWHPKRLRRQRLRIIWVLCAMPSLTLAVGLNGFFPWDFPGIQGQLKKSCGHIAPSSWSFSVVHYAMPNLPLEHWPSFSQDDPMVPMNVRDRIAERAKSEKQFQKLYKKEVDSLSKKRQIKYSEQVWKVLKPEIRNRPFLAWLLTVVAIINGSAWLAWLIAIAFLCAFLVPTLALVAIYARALANARLLSKRIAELDQDGRPEWQWYVDRIRESEHQSLDVLGGPNIKERDHLFLGVQPSADFPVLLDRKLLAEHAYFVGDSGSGKTSLGLMPLLIQLIRNETAGPGSEVMENATEPPPIIVLDLKGDMALFNTIKHESAARKPDSFYYFTPEPKKESCYFNPFQSLDSDNRSVVQLAQILLDALGLNHGEGYGKSYFARRIKHTMFAALNKKPKPKSISQLATRLFQMRDSEDAKDTFELLATIHSLQQYPQLETLSSAAGSQK